MKIWETYFKGLMSFIGYSTGFKVSSFYLKVKYICFANKGFILLTAVKKCDSLICVCLNGPVCFWLCNMTWCSPSVWSYYSITDLKPLNRCRLDDDHHDYTSEAPSPGEWVTAAPAHSSHSWCSNTNTLTALYILWQNTGVTMKTRAYNCLKSILNQCFINYHR